MPREGDGLSAIDPFVHSLQWSRRFTGLKLFLSLAVAGWAGYSATIGHQAEMGEVLRRRLVEENGKIVTRTSLPVICFTDADTGWDYATHQRIVDAVIASGEAWISTIRLGNSQRPALRASITNYRTESRHIDALLAVLNKVRDLERRSAHS
jgi:hypothetical protein